MQPANNDRQTKPHDSYDLGNQKQIETQTPEPTAGVGNFNPVGALVDTAYSGASYVTGAFSNFWYGKPEENQKNFVTKFNGKGLTPGQQLSFLSPTEHKNLGFDAKDSEHEGAVLFYGKLLCEGRQLKGEFNCIEKLPEYTSLKDFVHALTFPNEQKSVAMLNAFKEGLRNDPGVLAEQTALVMGEKLPVEQKVVHMMNLLNCEGVTIKQAQACVAKIPVEELKVFQCETHQTSDLITKEQKVETLKGVVKAVYDETIKNPTVVLNAMLYFQERNLGDAVKKHFALLSKENQAAVLKLQAEKYVEKHKDAKLYTENKQEVSLEASRAPGETVNAWCWGYIGGEPFHHFMEHRDAKPCGDTAKYSVTAMIKELEKKK